MILMKPNDISKRLNFYIEKMIVNNSGDKIKRKQDQRRGKGREKEERIEQNEG
jgi:hypothetical protein